MKELLRVINSLYNFRQQVRLIGKVKRGYLTSNFIIGNGREKYFLKGYLDGVRRIMNTHRAKDFFSRNGIPVILPIENKWGRTFFVHQGKVYAVFPFVDGKHYDRLKVPEKALENAGRLLARLHRLTEKEIPISVRKRKFIVNKKKALTKCEKLIRIIQDKKRKNTFDKASLAHLKAKLAAIKNNTVKFDRRKLGKRHVIHADYHESNMFFKGTGIAYLFDWEMVSRAPRVMEIARSLDFFCFFGSYGKRNFEMAKHYLSAYCREYPMEQDELLTGLRAWFYNKLHSMWSFEEYYVKGRKDSAKFIRKEIRAFDYYSGNINEFIQKIDQFSSIY